MSDMFVDTTVAVLQKVMDGTARRQQVLANNIANIDTPNYTRKDLTFEAELQTVIGTTSDNPDTRIEAINAVPALTQEDTKTARRADGNNVAIEREMSELAKNSLEYETAVQLLNMKLRALRSAIHEGRR